MHYGCGTLVLSNAHCHMIIQSSSQVSAKQCLHSWLKQWFAVTTYTIVYLSVHQCVGVRNPLITLATSSKWHIIMVQTLVGCKVDAELLYCPVLWVLYIDNSSGNQIQHPLCKELTWLLLWLLLWL